MRKVFAGALIGLFIGFIVGFFVLGGYSKECDELIAGYKFALDSCAAVNLKMNSGLMIYNQELQNSSIRERFIGELFGRLVRLIQSDPVSARKLADSIYNEAAKNSASSEGK
ncbi:hypothetical protein C4561_01365 [candidate division WWE3 bacterium]|uniref:Uncharacterized protein n=1 Tax=candidate division WWE3 bacterium TaxID=2053526 RepID=A0A3A4ZF17_UNCKA|nr:MAG: hypothetical protein C4561_01365 [candidate division WWE3 bacterium]